MSDEEDTKPRKRGRPKGSGKSTKGQPAPTLLNKKRRQYSQSLMQRIRDRVDPDLFIDHHTMILENKVPHWEPDGEGSWRVIPDPSPLAATPSLADKMQSIKWLTERGYGLPVQSIQVDAEYRHSLELLGSGVETQVLAGLNPAALAHLQQALQLVSGTPNEDAIDAEYVEIPANSDDTTQNSPLESTPSEPISENNEK